MKTFITLFELKNYYLLTVDHQNLMAQIFYNDNKLRYVPTLTGWITYWRKTVQEKKLTILYPCKSKDVPGVGGYYFNISIEKNYFIETDPF